MENIGLVPGRAVIMTREGAVANYVQHFFAAATEAVIVRFSEDDVIRKDLVYLEERTNTVQTQ